MRPDRCALGVEVSSDRRHTAVVVASRGPEGPDEATVVLELAGYLDGTATAVTEVLRLREELPVVSVVVDPHSQAATLLRPLQAAKVGELVEPGSSDLVVAHGVFLDELAAGRVRHVPSPELEAAARAGEQRRLGGAQTWDRRVEVDVSPLTAATLALWGLLTARAPAQVEVW